MFNYAAAPAAAAADPSKKLTPPKDAKKGAAMAPTTIGQFTCTVEPPNNNGVIEPGKHAVSLKRLGTWARIHQGKGLTIVVLVTRLQAVCEEQIEQQICLVTFPFWA